MGESPTGFCPAAVILKIIAGSLLVVVAVTVKVVAPLWFRPVALVMTIVSTGGLTVAVGEVTEVRVVLDAIVVVGAGAHDVAAGAGTPGHGFSWPTMAGEAGAGKPGLPGVYGPPPSARYGITSNALGNRGAPKSNGSGKM